MSNNTRLTQPQYHQSPSAAVVGGTTAVVYSSSDQQQHLRKVMVHHHPPPTLQQPYHIAKRARFDPDFYEDDEQQVSFGRTPIMQHSFQIRHRSTDKTRGLRHFAHKVCEKVKEKVQTNYNEVADELVTEYFDQLVEAPTDPEKYQYDARNIRRRVYDALNVLMAMNIIEKEKKEIRWVGLPTSSMAECRRLEEERTQRQERIRQKTEQLQELIVQLVAYKSLVQRNREQERLQGRPPDSSILYLPYIIVSTDKKTLVECAIAPDKSEYWFNFDRPFEIHDDIEVLKRLGLAYGIDRGDVDLAHVPHIKACLPPALRDYVDQILEGTLNIQPTFKQQTEPKITSQDYGLFEKKSLVKLDPNSGAVRTAPGDSIVVRATRANLSGIGPSGDTGPMGSFLAPVAASTGAKIANAQQQQPNRTATPVARYAVIPRPVSARYSSSFGASVGRYQQTVPHQTIQRNGMHQRLGGVLHDQYDYQGRGQFGGAQPHHQPHMAYMQEGGEEEYAMEEYGEEIGGEENEQGGHEMMVGEEEQQAHGGGRRQRGSVGGTGRGGGGGRHY